MSTLLEVYPGVGTDERLVTLDYSGLYSVCGNKGGGRELYTVAALISFITSITGISQYFNPLLFRPHK